LLVGVIWKFSPDWRGKPTAEAKLEALAGEDLERKAGSLFPKKIVVSLLKKINYLNASS